MTTLDPGLRPDSPAPQAHSMDPADAGRYEALAALDLPVFVTGSDETGYSLSNGAPGPDGRLVGAVGPLPAERLGSARFRDRYKLRYAYLAGAMAGGIASVEQVLALARIGALGSFGAAGLLPTDVAAAIDRIQSEAPGLPFAVNLIHSPSEAALERAAVELFLDRGVRTIEASAFMDVSDSVVRYRLAGLTAAADGSVAIGNRVIAKVSRAEIAEKFMSPAPAAAIRRLLEAGAVTEEQARLAERVPVADDITAEADSGGHTDRRPLTTLLDTVLRARDRIRRRYAYAEPIGVGAAGGIGTPIAAAAALAMGADYLVTGSINQGCHESGTSPRVRSMLAEAGVADVEMAPAADMFEMGVQLQVLKRGSMFAGRAKYLYELYRTRSGLDELTDSERERVEKTILGRPIEDVWAEVEKYFMRRDPVQIERAAGDPRRRMALVFRWYLGMASRWAVVGEPQRAMDYQIWCGPAMGAFNEWVAGTHLGDAATRSVADVAWNLLSGTAFHIRVRQLAVAGITLPPGLSAFRPVPSPAVVGDAR